MILFCWYVLSFGISYILHSYIILHKSLSINLEHQGKMVHILKLPCGQWHVPSQEYLNQSVWCCLEFLLCSHLAVTSSLHSTIKLNGCGWCNCLPFVIRPQALCRQEECLPYATQCLQHLHNTWVFLATYFFEWINR